MALSIDLRRRVVAAYKPGECSQEEVAKTFGVGICSVRRWITRTKELGSPERLQTAGRAPVISDSQLPDLVRLVGEKPDRTLQELCSVWTERFGIKITKSSMDRALSRASLTLKKRLSARVNEKMSELSKNGKNI